MQNTNSDHNVKKTTLMRLSQHYIWSIPTPSMPSSIIRFINYKFTPPFTEFNDCNNTFANEQANIGSNRRSVHHARALSTFLGEFCCGLFYLQKVGYSHQYLLIQPVRVHNVILGILTLNLSKDRTKI